LEKSEFGCYLRLQIKKPRLLIYKEEGRD